MGTPDRLIVRQEDGIYAVSIDARLYRRSAVKKAAYRLAKECQVVLKRADEALLSVNFLFSTQITDDRARAIIGEFFQELLDQELREMVADETAQIRALLLAQAFSKTNLICRD